MRRSAFTLIELVVVIMILGILATIATSKLLNTSAIAADNGLKQSLSVVREAIDLYAAENGGTLPGADGNEATFKKDLSPYLRGQFVVAPVGPAKGDSRVFMSNAGIMSGSPSPSKAWKYNYTTGEFIFNYDGKSSDGATNYADF